MQREILLRYLFLVYNYCNRNSVLFKIKNMSSEMKIVATPNYSKRTFTIRKYENGKFFMKYRTIPLSKEEFQSKLQNTENDWKQFLKSNDYYVVDFRF